MSDRIATILYVIGFLAITLFLAVGLGVAVRHQLRMDALLEECIKSGACPHPDACKEVGR